MTKISSSFDRFKETYVQLFNLLGEKCHVDIIASSKHS